MAKGTHSSLVTILPGTWEAAAMAINPPAEWSPEDLRGEIQRLHGLITRNHCPRDADTIETTIAGLHGRREIILNRALNRKDWAPELTAALGSSSALLGITIAAVLRDGGKVNGFEIALLVLTIIVALWSFGRLQANKRRAKDAKNEEKSGGDFDGLILALRKHIDESNEYLKDADGKYVTGIRGTPKDVKKLAELRERLSTVLAIDDRLERTRLQQINTELYFLRGVNMTDAFKRDVADLQSQVEGIDERQKAAERAGDALHAKMASKTETEAAPKVDSTSVRVVTGESAAHGAAEDEDAPRSATRKHEREA